MRRALVGIALWLSGCADDEAAADGGSDPRPQLDAAVPGIVAGDWFVCANDACSELETTGLRLALDHTVHHLTAAKPESGAEAPFVEGDPYCVGETFGTYLYGGGVLRLTLHDGGLVVDTDLVIDDSGLATHGGDMRKVAENPTGRWIDKACIAP